MVIWGSGARDQDGWQGVAPLAAGVLWTLALTVAQSVASPAVIDVRCGGQSALDLTVGGQSALSVRSGSQDALHVKGGSDVG
jgi:hypothetical protein